MNGKEIESQLQSAGWLLQDQNFVKRGLFCAPFNFVRGLSR